MREIPVTEVRAGDIARLNGGELRVHGEGDFVYGVTPYELAAVGVTFWREERALPDYPGAVVVSRDRDRCAVRVGDRGESFAPWLTTAGVPWKHDFELIEWLGDDWQETTTPPASEWRPVDADAPGDGSTT